MAVAKNPGAAPDQRDAADQNFDYMFKLLIIGNSSVGKTSFLFRYADDSFTSAFVSTVGIDFKVKTIYRSDKRIKLQIWVRYTKILMAQRCQLEGINGNAGESLNPSITQRVSRHHFVLHLAACHSGRWIIKCEALQVHQIFFFMNKTRELKKKL